MLLKWPILVVSVMGGNLEFLDFLKKSFITSTTGELYGKILTVTTQVASMT